MNANMSSRSGTVRVITVTFVDGSIQVSHDPLKIHPADSVRWEFNGVPGTWGQAIRFTQPAGVDPDRGPFTATLSPGSRLNAGIQVNTITGSKADHKRCEYKYDVVLTKPNEERIVLDPIIENDGGPPGTP